MKQQRKIDAQRRTRMYQLKKKVVNTYQTKAFQNVRSAVKSNTKQSPQMIELLKQKDALEAKVQQFE